MHIALLQRAWWILHILFGYCPCKNTPKEGCSYSEGYFVLNTAFVGRHGAVVIIFKSPSIFCRNCVLLKGHCSSNTAGFQSSRVSVPLWFLSSTRKRHTSFEPTTHKAEFSWATPWICPTPSGAPVCLFGSPLPARCSSMASQDFEEHGKPKTLKPQTASR